MINLKTFILLITFIFSFTINASDEAATEVTVITFEESMEDLSNRLIVSLFGLDALNWYETREISDLSTVDLNDSYTKKLIAPFNSELSVYSSSVFLSIIYVTVSLYLIYFIWITYFGFFKSQQSGDFLGKNWNTMFFAVKAMISFSLIMPFNGIEENFSSTANQEVLQNISPFELDLVDRKFNLAQAMVFRVAGSSNDLGKKINKTFFENQPRVYPTFRIPDSDLKIKDMQKIVSFFVCMKLNNLDNEDIFLDFTYAKSTLKGSFAKKMCSIEISIKADEQTNDIVATSNEVELTSILNFNDLQKNILYEAISEVLKYSDVVAENLISKKPFLSRDNQFGEYINGENSNIDKMNYWEDECESVLSDSFFIKEDGLTRKEREIYAVLSYRCLSKIFTDKIVAPKISSNTSSDKKYLKTKNYLKNNHIQLCTHDYDNIDEMKVRYNIGESSTKLDNQLSKFNTVLNVKFLPIKKCILEECSSLKSNFSNLYMCANSINLYNAIKEEQKYSNLGFLAFGSNLYNQFTSYSSENTKTPFNSFTVSLGKKDITISESPEYKLKIMSKKERRFTERTILTDLYTMSTNFIYENKIKHSNGTQNVNSLSNIVSDIFDNDFMGSKRLKTCISSPMQVSEGYACGSITQEYHSFGSNLFDTALKMKILFLALDSTRVTGGKILGNGDNSIDEKQKKNAFKIFIYASKLFAKIGFLVAYEQMEMFEKSVNVTDDFGTLTSQKQSSLYDNLATVGLVAITLSEKEKLMSYVSTILNSLIIFSLIFKYLIPLLPYYFFLGLIFSWVLLLFEMIILTPIWAAHIIKPTQNHTSEIVKKGLNLYLSLFLKIPFLMIGTLIAWIMTNTVSSRLMELFNFEVTMNVDFGQSLFGILDALVSVVIYAIILFIITNTTLQIMNSFYNFATKWITSGLDSSDTEKENTNKAMNDTTKQLKKFIKK